MDSEGSICFFVFNLVDINIYINCDSQSSLFNNFMDILVNFHNLRHKDDFLNNFLE